MAPELGNEDIVRYTVKEILAEIRHELIGVRDDVRDRYHKLASSIEGLDKRVTRTESVLENYEEIRKVREPQFEALIRGTAVRDAIAEAFAESKDKGFSRREKFGGLMIALVVAATTLTNLLLHLH